jgi:hypothetical protein
MKSEKRLTEECRYSEAITGSVLFRNDNGTGLRRNGEIFSYGLGSGSSDQIGYKETTITADMVGKKMAIFQVVEIKTLTDKISCKQIIFYLNILMSGGIAQIYTEDRFLTHDEIMNFPRRYEKPEVKAKYEKIISNLSKILKLSND